MTPLEFHKDHYHQEMRIYTLSCGVVCVMILCLTDVIDTQTQGHSIYRASIASREKSEFKKK